MNKTLSPIEFYERCKANNIPSWLWDKLYNTYIYERLEKSLNKLKEQNNE
jgi:hypothetical protein